MRSRHLGHVAARGHVAHIGALALAVIFHLWSTQVSAAQVTSAKSGVHHAHPVAVASARVIQSDAPKAPLAASDEAQYVMDWVRASDDNAGMPYVIIDKVNARVFVLDATGHVEGSAPALLGMIAGDEAEAGIGAQALATMRPDQRVTPAGRFVASLARDLHGKPIVWIDYASALALHRVVKGTPTERRAQRLESSTAADNRISYGCVNLPGGFYDKVVLPAFASSSGVVYILPEKSPARSMFK